MSRLRLALPLALVALAACSSSSSGDRKDPILASALPGAQGLTTFLQCIPLKETPDGSYDYEMFPGCANVWDLDTDLSLSDGGNDQWDGALELFVGTLPTSPATYTSLSNETWNLDVFGGVAYGTLSFRTPAFGASDGVPVAVVSDGATLYDQAISGHSAYLAPGTDNRLQQTLDLRTATAPVTLGLTDYVELGWSYMPNAPAPSYDIVLRNPTTGDALETLQSLAGWNGVTARTFDLSAYAGQTVTLSFELHATPDPWNIPMVIVDDVSVTDGASHELVTNGTFEAAGLAGWTAKGAPESYEVVTAPQLLAGLNVTRAVYTTPRSAWARWVDTFENPGASAVTADVVYHSNLGSDGSGIIYQTPGTTGALSSYDGTNPEPNHYDDRDVALVYGDGQAFFESATSLAFNCAGGATSCGDDGSDEIYITHRITVPASGRVVLVHFIVQGGSSTADTATSAAARATEVDQIAAGVANGFRKDVTLRDYMTAEELAAVTNF